MFEQPWTGVFPATLCPFLPDYRIDEEGLRAYSRYLASVEGIKGLVCNGHTGEVMSLTVEERAKVTRIMKDEVGDRVKVISGVCAEGTDPAIAEGLAAKAAGADGILLMPPHHWLRFGRTPETAVGFVRDVADAVDLPIILHQYPAWTKACYSLAEMLEIVKIPQVVMIKMGTRDMSRWRWDYLRLKEAAPHVSIVTCHDEYLLPTLLEGADGALVGFAGFVPDLIVRIVKAALAGDLEEANRARELVYPLSLLVYKFGEPSSNAHQRMKYAMTRMGKFPSELMRRPMPPLSEEEKAWCDRMLKEYEAALEKENSA